MPKNTLESAPYDRNGNMLHYAGYGEIDWRPNTIFEAEMVVDDTSRGRSAAYFNVHDMNTGVKYTMFITDILDLLKRGEISEGVTAPSKWYIRKRGQNYGLALA